MPHREVRREASAVTAKIQHGRSWFAASERIMRLYAFPAHVRHAGRCRTYHAHRKSLAEQTDNMHSHFGEFFGGFFFSPNRSVGQRGSTALRRKNLRCSERGRKGGWCRCKKTKKTKNITLVNMLVEYKNMPNLMEHQGKLRALASFSVIWFRFLLLAALLNTFNW